MCLLANLLSIFQVLLRSRSQRVTRSSDVTAAEAGRHGGVLASALSFASIVGPLAFSTFYFAVQKQWPGEIWLAAVVVNLVAVPCDQPRQPIDVIVGYLPSFRNVGQYLSERFLDDSLVVQILHALPCERRKSI